MSRLLAVALGAAVVIAGVAGLMALFSARDDSGVKRSGGPGTLEPDRGAEHRPSGDRASDELPTSGPHQPDLITRDGRALSDDRILHALELGAVVIAYPSRRPPPELVALQETVSGPFDAELAAAGQAVVLARVPGLDGVQALAWRHRLRARDPGDPALREFADYWLGRGLEGG